ncbi:biotin/lipoyl-containing protein [Desemzia incerta]|uniref:biotin/lipoyl-containing protein n=1 Tax=Desemzia incerta TaxID=82801 RepID=UPI003D07AD46
MKHYEITVNGQVYQVTVEEVDAAASTSNHQQIPEKTQQKPPLQQSIVSEKATVVAPMPGTILRVLVNEGQTIKAGEVLCILEAMKMENEIVAPTDGVIASLKIGANQKVDSGDSLVVIS